MGGAYGSWEGRGRVQIPQSRWVWAAWPKQERPAFVPLADGKSWPYPEWAKAVWAGRRGMAGGAGRPGQEGRRSGAAAAGAGGARIMEAGAILAAPIGVFSGAQGRQPRLARGSDGARLIQRRAGGAAAAFGGGVRLGAGAAEGQSAARRHGAWRRKAGAALSAVAPCAAARQAGSCWGGHSAWRGRGVPEGGPGGGRRRAPALGKAAPPCAGASGERTLPAARAAGAAAEQKRETRDAGRACASNKRRPRPAGPQPPYVWPPARVASTYCLSPRARGASA
jgi:hypothetical protein